MSLSRKKKTGYFCAYLPYKYFAVGGRCCCTRYLSFSGDCLCLPMDNWDAVPALHFANFLVLSGCLSAKALDYILLEKKSLSEDLKVLVLGACARQSIKDVGLDDRFRPYIYVPGCPVTEIQITKVIEQWVTGDNR